jgi:hypothetical protein
MVDRVRRPGGDTRSCTSAAGPSTAQSHRSASVSRPTTERGEPSAIARDYHRGHRYLQSKMPHSTQRILAKIASIGAKAFGSFAANDNGFIRFQNVRIPLSCMLSKFARVTENGEYVVPPHAKLSYGGVCHCKQHSRQFFGFIYRFRCSIFALGYAFIIMLSCQLMDHRLITSSGWQLAKGEY